MCSIVCGDGLPLNNAIVTLSLPTATPFSNSNSLRNPKARRNHFALFFGSRTASPKWPTTPSINGGFMERDYKTAEQTSNAQRRILTAAGIETAVSDRGHRSQSSARGLLFSVVCSSANSTDAKQLFPKTLPKSLSEDRQQRSTQSPRNTRSMRSMLTSRSGTTCSPKPKQPRRVGTYVASVWPTILFNHV